MLGRLSGDNCGGGNGGSGDMMVVVMSVALAWYLRGNVVTMLMWCW